MTDSRAIYNSLCGTRSIKYWYHGRSCRTSRTITDVPCFSAYVESADKPVIKVETAVQSDKVFLGPNFRLFPQKTPGNFPKKIPRKIPGIFPQNVRENWIYHAKSFEKSFSIEIQWKVTFRGKKCMQNFAQSGHTGDRRWSHLVLMTSRGVLPMTEQAPAKPPKRPTIHFGTDFFESPSLYQSWSRFYKSVSAVLNGLSFKWAKYKCIGDVLCCYMSQEFCPH
jgi:hypothetical protein